MNLRKSRIRSLALLVLLAFAAYETGAREVGRLYSGVIKVRAGIDEGEPKLRWRTSAGFVVRSDPGGHYILTMARNVKGADRIEVEYFYRRGRYREAKVVHMEGRDKRGIALLFVRGRPPVGTKTFAAQPKVAPGASVRLIGLAGQARSDWKATPGKLGGVGSALTFTGRIDGDQTGAPLVHADGRVLGIVAGMSAGGGALVSTRAIEARFEEWDFEWSPPAPGNQSLMPFPHTWSRAYPGFRPVQLLKDGIFGYLLFGHFAEGETPEGRPNWRSAVLRLDGDLRPVGRDNFHARPLGSTEIVRVVRIKDRTFVLEKMNVLAAPNIRTEFDDMRVLMLDAASKPPGRELYRENVINPQASELFDAGSGLIGYSDGGKIHCFDIATGKKQDGQFIPGYLNVRVPGKNGELLSLVLESSRGRLLTRKNLKGEKLQQRDLKVGHVERVARIVPLPDGHILVALYEPPPGQDDEQTFIAKFDPNLNPLWRRQLTFPNIRISRVRDFWVLRNGSMLLALADFSAKHGWTSALVFVDRQGKERWRKSLKERGENDNGVRFADLLELSDGSFLVTGEHGVYFEEKAAGDGFIWRLDQRGNFLPTPGASRRHARK